MGRKLFTDKKEKIVAVCIAGIDEHAQIDYMHALGVWAEKRHFKLIFFTSFSSICMEEKYFDGEMSVYSLINYQMLDALILFVETIKNDATWQQIVAEAEDAGVPVITVDHQIEGCYNILFDYRSAMDKLMQHVIGEHDFERIEYIGGIPNNPASEERLEIFKLVMERNGKTVTADQIHYGYFWAGPTEEVMDEICARPREEMPDAIICGNDAMAIVACRRLKEAGYQVPDDIAITGFDGIREALDHTPSLTTASLNYWAVMDKAFDIIEEISSGKQVPEEYKIDFEVIFGESCGCKNDFEHKDSGEMVQNLYKQIYNNHFFSNRMLAMTASMADSVSLDDAMEKIKPFLESNVAAEKCWICITDPYILDIKALEEGINNTHLNGSGFTDRIRCLIYKNGREYEHNIHFELEEILPEMDKVLDGTEELLLLPLHLQERLIGYLVISFRPWQNDYYQLQSFVNSLSMVLERLKYQVEQKELMESLRDKSMHDPLTGILNRRGFFEQLEEMYEESIKEDKMLSVISLDMDGLKKINDTFGHAVGDIAIADMAGLLEKVCGENMICSRIGGDEFTAAGIVSNEILSHFEERMREALKQCNAADKPYKIDCSIGIFSAKPKDGIQIDDFIRFADAKMYEQKEYHHRLTGYTR
ncbi:MAG: GGDEF domain-containing protein [Lachnospiraceae bacterium]|nr:GGDEF domain-containing protein [Lachnospiraceae bacterium]